MKSYEELSKLRKEIPLKMGLAASQARLLTITTRKSDCEFQSMRYSHQKIALSRDLTNISNEYQNSLNATKLVYDFYGTGDKTTPVGYNLLMTPSELNSYMPMLTTDSSGRVVLDNRYAAAAKAAGIPQEGLGCQPSQTVRNKFLEGLREQGIINQEKYDSFINIPYFQNYGVGDSKYIISEETAQLTLRTMIDNYLDSGKANSIAIDLDEIKSTLELGNSSGYVNDVKLSKEIGDTLGVDTGEIIDPITGRRKSGNKIEGNTYVGVDTGESLNIKEILEGNYKLLVSVTDDSEAAVDNFQYLSILENIFEEINKIFGTSPDALNAIDYASVQIQQWLTDASTVAEGTSIYKTNTFTKESGSNGYSGIIDCMESNKNNDYKSTLYKLIPIVGWIPDNYRQYTKGTETDKLKGIMYLRNNRKVEKFQADGAAINLSNIAKMYMTYLVQALEEAEFGSSELNIVACDKENDTKLIGENDKLIDFGSDDDLNKVFTITTRDGINKDQTLISAAYDAIFTQICLRGWVQNDKVNDNEYLQDMYKSGQLFICKCFDDGYYYQENYGTETFIKEVTDDDAIAKAEAKYNTEKQKLNHKEEILDLKMKNLDAEISSLTTEYDSVKNLISKNAERSFKRYDA